MAVVVESAFRHVHPCFMGAHSHCFSSSNTLSVAICRCITRATRGLEAAEKSGDIAQLQQCKASFIAAVPSILSLHMTHFKLACILLDGDPRGGKYIPRPDGVRKGMHSTCLSEYEEDMLRRSFQEIHSKCGDGCLCIQTGNDLMSPGSSNMSDLNGKGAASLSDERRFQQAWLRMQLVMTRTFLIMAKPEWECFHPQPPPPLAALATAEHAGQRQAATAPPPDLGGVLSMHLAVAAKGMVPPHAYSSAIEHAPKQPTPSPYVPHSSASIATASAAESPSAVFKQSAMSLGATASTVNALVMHTASGGLGAANVNTQTGMSAGSSQHGKGSPSLWYGSSDIDPLINHAKDACGIEVLRGAGAAVAQSTWELFAFTHLGGAVFPGCSYMGCTNLGGNCEMALKTALCAGCRRARYCGLACQKAAWSGGHNAVCESIHVSAAVSAEVSVSKPVAADL